MKPDPFRDHPLVATWDSVHAVRTRQDCFADEIAVDFPSNGHFVERVRDAFLADAVRDEGGDTHRTQICLSRAQAHRGAVLPLDVPVRSTCRACGGRGESWAETCPGCLGTGDSLEHRRFRVPLPPGVADGARFRFRVRSRHGAGVRVEVTVVVSHEI